MLGYFPELLPDELFYSALARLSHHRGRPAGAKIMRDFFGRRHAIASFDLPGSLVEFVSKCGPGHRFDVDTIIDHGTLFPFYTAFASQQIRDATREAMKGCVTGVHTQLGLTAFRIPPLRSLRFCQRCMALMDTEGGERFWRRSHQLSGIIVCADHGVPLRMSNVVLGDRIRHRFVTAEGCQPSSGADELTPADSITLRRLQGLAASAVGLLHHPPAARTLGEHTAYYQERLREVGLMSGAKVDQVGLAQAFCAHWGKTLDFVPSLLVNGALRGGWLASMVRNRQHGAHPVCHLLLRSFLEAQEQVDRPFGCGPWECRNPVATHAGEACVQSIVVRKQRTMRYGDFSCECGYSYTRSLCADGRLGHPRMRTFGPLLEPALRKALGDGLGLRAIAQTFRLDPKTLVRQAAIAGVSLPWSLKPSGSIIRQPVACRSKELSRSNDRPRGRGGKARDWSLVDRRLARGVPFHAAKIRSEKPPVRVTFAEIERRVARNGWIAKRREKLPMTSKRVVALAEDTNAFRIRRLAWAMDAFQAEGVDPTPADLLRRAGLPSGWMPNVRRELARQARLMTANLRESGR